MNTGPVCVRLPANRSAPTGVPGTPPDCNVSVGGPVRRSCLVEEKGENEDLGLIS